MQTSFAWGSKNLFVCTSCIMTRNWCGLRTGHALSHGVFLLWNKVASVSYSRSRSNDLMTRAQSNERRQLFDRSIFSAQDSQHFLVWKETLTCFTGTSSLFVCLSSATELTWSLRILQEWEVLVNTKNSCGALVSKLKRVVRQHFWFSHPASDKSKWLDTYRTKICRFDTDKTRFLHFILKLSEWGAHHNFDQSRSRIFMDLSRPYDCHTSSAMFVCSCSVCTFLGHGITRPLVCSLPLISLCIASLDSVDQPRRQKPTGKTNKRSEIRKRGSLDTPPNSVRIYFFNLFWKKTISSLQTSAFQRI